MLGGDDKMAPTPTPPPAAEVPGSGLYHPGRGGNRGGGSPISLCPGRVGDPG